MPVQVGVHFRVGVAVALALVLGVCGVAVGARSAPASRPAGHTGHGWASLPVDARAAVSRALGGDDVRYWARDGGGDVVRFANPLQHLSASLSGGTVRVGERNGLRLELTPVAVGSGAASGAIGVLRPAGGSHNRVSFAGAGIREWFANGPYGIEQGFTVARAPIAADRTGTIRVTQAISGDVRARVDPNGHGVRFSGPGSSLLYGGLLAFDARGRRLASRMSVSGRRLTITVHGAGAVYPVMIDPTFQQSAELTASDGVANDALGMSVAMSGSTIVAGAPGRNSGKGAVYVFSMPGSGGWVDATRPRS